MGGYGSGQWYRWDKRSTTNDYKSIDIPFIKKHALFEEGSYCSNTIRWRRNGEETGSVGYRVDMCEASPYMRLIYSVEDEKYDYKVRLVSTTPNYGGKRWWFICPASGCGRRVGVLSMAARYLRVGIAIISLMQASMNHL